MSQIPMPHFFYLHLSISDGFDETKIFDKWDDFDFDIVNFPFLDGDVRFARVSSHVDDITTRIEVFTARILRQGYRYHKLHKAFSKFCLRHFDLVSKYNVGLKNFFCKVFLNLIFMATWCINSEK